MWCTAVKCVKYATSMESITIQTRRTTWVVPSRYYLRHIISVAHQKPIRNEYRTSSDDRYGHFLKTIPNFQVRHVRYALWRYLLEISPLPYFDWPESNAAVRYSQSLSLVPYPIRLPNGVAPQKRRTIRTIIAGGWS